VVPQALAPEHLGQASPRLRVVALDEAEAPGGTVPGNRFAHDRDEVGLLVLPVPQVAAVETDGILQVEASSSSVNDLVAAVDLATGRSDVVAISTSSRAAGFGTESSSRRTTTTLASSARE
jgi:hypothetical protein